jgi:hypothetical protein
MTNASDSQQVAILALQGILRDTATLLEAVGAGKCSPEPLLAFLDNWCAKLPERIHEEAARCAPGDEERVAATEGAVKYFQGLKQCLQSAAIHAKAKPQ